MLDVWMHKNAIQTYTSSLVPFYLYFIRKIQRLGACFGGVMGIFSIQLNPYDFFGIFGYFLPKTQKKVTKKTRTRQTQLRKLIRGRYQLIDTGLSWKPEMKSNGFKSKAYENKIDFGFVLIALILLKIKNTVAK